MADDFGIIPKSVHIDPRTDPLSWGERKAIVMFLSECDDWGRFNGSPRALSRLLGGTTEEIEADLVKLEGHKLISRYRVTVKATKIEYYVSEITGWDAYLGHNKKRKNEQRDGLHPDRNGVFPKGRSHRAETVNDLPGITKGDGGDNFQSQPGAQRATSGELGQNGADSGEPGRPRIGQVRAEQRSESGDAQTASPERPTAGPTAGALDGPPRGSSPSPEPNTKPDPKPKHRPRLTKAEIDALPGLEKARYHVERRAMREWRERQGQRGEEDAATEAETVAGPGFVVGTAAWDPEPKGGRWVRYDASPGELAWRPWQPGEPGYVAPPVEAKPPEPTPEELAAEQARIVAEREARAKADAERKEAERAAKEAEAEAAAKRLAETEAKLAAYRAQAERERAALLPWPNEALEARCMPLIANFVRTGGYQAARLSRDFGDLMAKAGLDVATRALDRLDAMGESWEGWRKQDPWLPLGKLLADAAKPALAPVPDP